MSGYTANLPYLAAKIGELQAVSDSVLAAAAALDAGGGDLGPGDINAAVRELADAWRDGIEEIGTRIDEMSGHVSSAMDNYAAVEDAARAAFAGDPVSESQRCPVSPVSPVDLKGGRP